MKRNLFLTVVLTISISTVSFAQNLGDMGYTLTFEDSSELQHLIIDTVSNKNHLWQIGVPHKTIFLSGNTLPNAIVTDTINSYPVNDTSSFEIMNVVDGLGWEFQQVATLTGYYEVNSDTLTDYGRIEFSPDNGATWIDLINDTAYTSYYFWYNAKPVLSGNLTGWQNFTVSLAPLGHLFNVQIGDTVLYRFTFVSDSVQTNKDGLMFDDLHFEDWVEGIQEIQNDDLISISPNPTDENLFIHKTKHDIKESIQIFNYTGQLVFENSHFVGETINTRPLNNGIYLLKYSDSNNYAMKKFVVQH